MEMHLTVFLSDSPEIRFETVTTHTESVVQEALIFQFEFPVSELILKSAKLAGGKPVGDYWLARQGAMFGKGTRSAFIYHTPRVSSLVVKGTDRILWVNLDYANDHPHIAPDPGATWIDRSNSTYHRGQVRHNEFSIYVGYEPSFFPRLTRTPHGFLSTYVWTEHGCNSDLHPTKAVYLGAQDVKSHRDATGGFARHGIPVTKSVFFANRNTSKVWNSGREATFCHSDMLAIESNEEFRDFLLDLHESGQFEICLHCPQPTTSSPEELEDAVAFMKRTFDTVSWIDHLVLKERHISGCHESFGCYGLEPGHKSSAYQIWRRYGTRYFWNNALEYIDRIPKSRGLRRWRFVRKVEYILSFPLRVAVRVYEGRPAESCLGEVESEFEVAPLTVGALNNMGGDESVPNPVYWRHPTVTQDLYSWGTFDSRSYRFYKGDSWKNYEKRMDALVASWGVFIHHGYMSRCDRGSGYWVINKEGKVVVSEEFDSCLANMAAYRDDRRVYFTTVRDAMDYWLKLEGVELKYVPELDQVQVCNHNRERIEGMSMAVRSEDVFVNGERPLSRRVGDEESIFWFDLDGLSYVAVSDSAESSIGEGTLSSVEVG